MNDLIAQNITAKSAASLPSSLPHIPVPKKEKVQPEAEIFVQVGGKELPPITQTVETKVEDKEVKEAVSKLNEFVQKTNRNLDFQIDEESGKTVIKVYDSITAKLVRQIPDEAALELAKKLNSEEPSLLFSAQV
jgi:flagellar protein FlaG